MNRPMRGEARTAILEAAERLFYRNGIHAVGVDTVAEEAGITKRTLYYHFSTKDALVAAYLTRYDALNRGPLMHQAEQFGPLPGDHILGLVEAIAARFAFPEYRGCAFLNAIVESGSEPTAARACVTTHKDGVRDWIETKLVQAGAKDASALAEQMMLLVDGAFMRALMYPDSAIARHAQDAAVTLLQTAGIAITRQE